LPQFDDALVLSAFAPADASHANYQKTAKACIEKPR
jgi:hypothetical protein